MSNWPALNVKLNMTAKLSLTSVVIGLDSIEQLIKALWVGLFMLLGYVTYTFAQPPAAHAQKPFASKTTEALIATKKPPQWQWQTMTRETDVWDFTLEHFRSSAMDGHCAVWIAPPMMVGCLTQTQTEPVSIPAAHLINTKRWIFAQSSSVISNDETSPPLSTTPPTPPVLESWVVNGQGQRLIYDHITDHWK